MNEMEKSVGAQRDVAPGVARLGCTRSDAGHEGEVEGKEHRGVPYPHLEAGVFFPPNRYLEAGVFFSPIRTSIPVSIGAPT